MQKEINIEAPEGYEIDKEKSTFERIVFKKKKNARWRDKFIMQSGYEIGNFATVVWKSRFCKNNGNHLFATEKQAKSALAMAQISQIMANDKRFGGVVTDEEWADDNMRKFVIGRKRDTIGSGKSRIWPTEAYIYYFFLAFHTFVQRDLFLEENEDLVKQYLMLD